MGATLFLDKTTVYIDTVDKESKKYTNDVTHFPVESGASITDDIINKNPQINLVGYVSAYPIVFMSSLSPYSINMWDSLKSGSVVTQQYTSPNDAEQILTDFWELGTPISATIKNQLFENLAIKQLQFNADSSTGDSLHVTLSLERIKIVTSKTTAVPDNITDPKTKDDASKNTDLGTKPTQPASKSYLEALWQK
ncbi:hypothetical protein PsalMR5_04877 (plasmid) [Piscirickettsia salmonis]|uniref:phage baseplate protein n=1 Tax=Piscirickettsia salmonis TaxID=1238 RepID=UPI0012BA70FF|nr:hypothetical protein [Piscirickettsia salmonis]QGP57358.1 hypothetical protein PsalSR1_04847 [Piscirickettsia salmonis]QGP66952.1 hypothetical protein PsalMR5_04877 [Piscirickettsia salmonis]